MNAFLNVAVYRKSDFLLLELALDLDVLSLGSKKSSPLATTRLRISEHQ